MSKESNLVSLNFPEFDFYTFLLRVVVAMSQSGMSHYDLAYHTTLSHSTIARIMSRRSKNMYIGTVARIAKALGVSTDFLIGQREARTKREKGIDEEVYDYQKWSRKRA